MSEHARVAIVTGASRGLGAAIARRLAGDGWAVVVNHRSSGDQAAAVVDDIRGDGGAALAVAADVTDEQDVQALIARTVDDLGSPGALVLNATGPQPHVAVDDLTWDHHLDQLRFFVQSPTLLLRAALPAMSALGRGRVIQIGSDAVERARPGTSPYVVAKAAQLALTRTWAQELGPRGITVNMVAPGWIPVERHDGVPAHELAAYRDEVPVGRMGAPDDVAGVVAFLASDAAGFVTGQRILVNGGHTIG